MPMRGNSGFSKENFLSHSTEKLRRGTFLRFTKFLLSKKFMDKRVGRGREYHDFLSKKFLSHSTENLRTGPISVSLLSGV